MSGQITLPVDDLEGLVNAVVERKIAQGIGPKHFRYKGDPYWLAVRENALRLCHEFGAVCYDDVENDPWFMTELPKLDVPDHAGLDHVVKWDRAVKKLTTGDPRSRDDNSEIIMFDVPRRGAKTRFVALRPEFHCGVERACRVVGMSHERRGAVIANIRRRWGAKGPCPRCAAVVLP